MHYELYIDLFFSINFSDAIIPVINGRKDA